MPRLARLDAPGILQHVIGQGIERKKIFFDDTDRSDFIWGILDTHPIYHHKHEMWMMGLDVDLY